jgi:hypothetical protein
MGNTANPDESSLERAFKFVNWGNIQKYNSTEGTDRAPTLEFRQHHATLSTLDVSQWVCFLTALVRLAER